MNALPPLADEADVLVVLCVCRKGHAMISRSHDAQTERFLIGPWNSSFARLQRAVVEHIDANRKVFKKFDCGRLLIGHLQANVTLYDGLDIYVEMRIAGTQIVVLAAHTHYIRPLPQ